MKAIIIEDEKLSAEHLCNLLRKIDSNIEVVDIYDSVRKTIDGFMNGIKVDLLFVDIQLADGLSFEIFNSIDVDIPIIFTTAYDEFAVRAFKLNSVDYLLKPIGQEDLRFAVEKFKKHSQQDHTRMLENFFQSYESLKKPFKSRFMIKMGESIFSIKTGEIVHFIFEDGIVLIVTNSNHQYPVDFTLDQLEPILNPAEFFRINRKVIVNINSIQKSGTYFNSRLKIVSSFLHNDNSIVSRERVSDFKEWLGR